MLNPTMAWKIRVRFGGKSLVKEFVSNDIRHENPRWGDEFFHQGIESFEFFLPTAHRLVLAGMEQYNFFVEASAPFGGGNPTIDAFWFLGKPPGDQLVECVRIREGQVVRERHRMGTEWGGGSTAGWKRGVIGGKVICQLVQGH